MDRQIELAWAAGIIDGEGSIFISKQAGVRRKTPAYQAVIKVAMSHKETIEYIASLFPGSITTQQRGTNRPMYMVQATSTKALGIIESLLPFLVTKKKQARLVLLWDKYRQKGKGGPKNTLSESEVNRSEYYRATVSSFNL